MKRALHHFKVNQGRSRVWWYQADEYSLVLLMTPFPWPMLIHLWTKVTKQLASGVINGTIHVSRRSRIDYDGRVGRKRAYERNEPRIAPPTRSTTASRRSTYISSISRQYGVRLPATPYVLPREIKRKKFTDVAREGTWRVLSGRDTTSLSARLLRHWWRIILRFHGLPASSSCCHWALIICWLPLRLRRWSFSFETPLRGGKTHFLLMRYFVRSAPRDFVTEAEV